MNGFDVRAWASTKWRPAAWQASASQYQPNMHSAPDGQVVAIGGDELEEELEVVVADVGVTSFLPSRSITQTYIWRAWRSIPQLNWVVEVWYFMS